MFEELLRPVSRGPDFRKGRVWLQTTVFFLQTTAEAKPDRVILAAGIGGVTQKIYHTNSHNVTMQLRLVMGLANSSIEASIESLLP